MQTGTDCIFCKIVAGDLPCTKIFEDDKVLAFMDICPVNKGHLLVVPKQHFETITDIDPELYGHVASVLCKLAKAVRKSLNPAGMNVLQLNGEAGNQVVPHVHMHLVPRDIDDGLAICAWKPELGDQNEIRDTAEMIKAALP